MSDNFPKIHALTDSKGRNALHYAAAAESSGGNYYKIISNAVGADKGFNLIMLVKIIQFIAKLSYLTIHFIHFTLSLFNICMYCSVVKPKDTVAKQKSQEASKISNEVRNVIGVVLVFHSYFVVGIIMT